MNGIEELWGMKEEEQESLIAASIEKFETRNHVSLAMLGFSNVRAADLVRNRSRVYGSRLIDRDILTALVMANLEVYPLRAIKSLGPDSLDCGIWDGEFGEAGYYWKQDGTDGVGVINPGDPACVHEMWSGPHRIPRVKELERQYRHINTQNMEGEDGCLILQPGIAYLFGFWPAVKVNGLNITLETRSNFGRWALAGAVNSITVHTPYNGVLTAEATTFAHRQMALNTRWLPFQMGFEHVGRSMDREVVLTFSGSPEKSLTEAAREFQLSPEKMLPRQAIRQRD